MEAEIEGQITLRMDERNTGVADDSMRTAGMQGLGRDVGGRIEDVADVNIM